MKLRGVLLIGMLFFLMSSAFGFDGARRGFVLGGGIGFSPASSWEIDNPILGVFSVKASEAKAGLGLNLIIGYAWNEKNMIVYEGNVSGYSSDALDQTLTQGYNGATWYHYYGNVGRTIFTTVGLGIYSFDGEDFDSFNPGAGILLGAGYEFSPHWQIGLYLGVGKASKNGIDLKLYHINFVFDAIAF